MRVSVYSREAIEHIIAEGSFPNNTAVISFCDPELKHIGKDNFRVDYTSVCDDVFYCEVDDLDLDYLPEKGYTYESFFPETPELAEYIDSVSISLNAANAEEYNKVTRPSFDNAYEAMLDFAEECNRMIKHTQLSIVDVLPEEDIKTCQQIADERGIHLKIRHFSN